MTVTPNTTFVFYKGPSPARRLRCWAVHADVQDHRRGGAVPPGSKLRGSSWSLMSLIGVDIQHTIPEWQTWGGGLATAPSREVHDFVNYINFLGEGFFFFALNSRKYDISCH